MVFKETQWPTAVVLKLDHAPESPGKLVKTQGIPKIPDWVGLNLHSRQAPGDSDAAGTLRARALYLGFSGLISLRLCTQIAFLNWQNQENNYGQGQR